MAKAISKKEATVSVLCPSNPNMSFDRVTEMINVLGDETTVRRWKRDAMSQNNCPEGGRTMWILYAIIFFGAVFAALLK